MTTRKNNNGPVRSVPPKQDNYGVHAFRSALANLAASEALDVDDPAQAVLIGRAQAYATLAISQFATWAQ